jgi:branched-chain amino acid transport system ATP-binding protein
MTPLLEIADLTAAYGPVRALHGVDLSVAEGRVVALLGPNGAGKTTTLRAVCGMVKAAGTVRLRDRDLLGLPPERVVRLGVAHVPEGRGVITELTVEENLRLGLAARRTRGDTGEALRGVYELFPIVGDFRHRQAGKLSGGQQQQLAIARALVADPHTLLLDEPSLGLAPTIVDVVFDALAAIRERGFAVLLVEQRAQRTVAAADRSHVIANGELRLTLGPEQAGDTAAMVEAYFS